MAGIVSKKLEDDGKVVERPFLSEPRWIRVLLITAALVFLAFFLVLPIAMVLTQALKKGFAFYLHSLSNPVALSAIRLTLIVAIASVPLNLLFGLAASWRLQNLIFGGRNS